LPTLLFGCFHGFLAADYDISSAQNAIHQLHTEPLSAGIPRVGTLSFKLPLSLRSSYTRLRSSYTLTGSSSVKTIFYLGIFDIFFSRNACLAESGCHVFQYFPPLQML
jgi:hypothetical protein